MSLTLENPPLQGDALTRGALGSCHPIRAAPPESLPQSCHNASHGLLETSRHTFTSLTFFFFFCTSLTFVLSPAPIMDEKMHREVTCKAPLFNKGTPGLEHALHRHPSTPKGPSLWRAGIINTS